LKHPNIVQYEDAFQVTSAWLRTMAISTLLLSIVEEEISEILLIAIKKTNK
jgi:hypothetical protein